MERPEVIKWFKVYAGALVVIYLAAIAGGVALVVFADTLSEGIPLVRAAFASYGVILVVISLALGGLAAATFFLPRKPWVWTYDLILIAIGFSGGITAIAGAFLLVFWLRPDVQAWFHRVAALAPD